MTPQGIYTVPLAETKGLSLPPLARPPRKLAAYDAIVPKGRRQPPVARTRSEDFELRGNERQILNTSVRDLRRNFSIAAWAIRRHLDYVSTFSFQARTGNAALDDKVEALVEWWSRPQNFDAGGRLSLRRGIRMAENLRTTDGDGFVLKRRDGKVQFIEGDRVRDPIGNIGEVEIDRSRMTNGVLTNKDGGAEAFAVHRRLRDSGGFEFERLIPAAFCRQHAYLDRYDQLRGITPMAASVNMFRDAYEGIDYALAKAKVDQLLGLKTKRASVNPIGATDETTYETGDGETEDRTDYTVDLGGGPWHLDLDPGDDAELMTTQNPSTQFQAFMQATVAMALKAVDIPYSFYDESFTTYSGSRQALQQYELSANIKRDDNRELLDDLTAWRLGLFIIDGHLELPDGMRLGDLRWEWIHRTVRWVDPLKEVMADLLAVKSGFKSPPMIAKANGDDPFEVLDQTAEWQKYARDKGVVLPEIPLTISLNTDVEKEEKPKENEDE